VSVRAGGYVVFSPLPLSAVGSFCGDFGEGFSESFFAKGTSPFWFLSHRTEWIPGESLKGVVGRLSSPLSGRG